MFKKNNNNQLNKNNYQIKLKMFKKNNSLKNKKHHKI